MQFFEETEKTKSPKQTFKELTGHLYHIPKNIEENTPYVCVRIPTGGGKTIMATHALCRIAKEYLHTHAPLCLWLAPTDTIVSQTLKSMCTRNHPCYNVLKNAFGGHFNCIDIKKASEITANDIQSVATVIVCTVQSLRVSDEYGRKVYWANGNLMSHFQGLPEELRKNLEQNNRVVHPSLANVIRLHRPIIISDEAHKAGTKLSYETFSRFMPSCIVEWTATPQVAPGYSQKQSNRSNQKKKLLSNVISQASAFELKQADMIKFPLNFRVINNWRDNITAAVKKQEELEEAAKRVEKNSYIRPIVLYQAENQGQQATVEKIKNELMNKHGIPEKEIAVHTGNKKELEKRIVKTDLMSKDCEIRHIITIQALTEGWDCSFAYILCTMANLSSSRAVEQVLGRILRLPGASSKSVLELNECYAFAVSSNVYEVAKSLRDALINQSGFQKIEADEFAQSEGVSGSLFDDGQQTVPQISKRKPIEMPRLMVSENGELEFLEKRHFLGKQWGLKGKEPDMSGFRIYQNIRGGIVYVDSKGKVDDKIIELENIDDVRGQLNFLKEKQNWSLERLVKHLDREIPHEDIPQTQSLRYILDGVNQLLEKGHSLEDLGHWEHHIKEYLEKEIEKLRNKEKHAIWQMVLNNHEVDRGKLEVSVEHVLKLEERYYAPSKHDDSGTKFQNHMFAMVGKFDSKEELQCAQFLDGMPEIEGWVRNLTHPVHSFWLQTKTNKFYPDFVCRLTDGRILVVEYKGEDRWKDAQEKRDIGKIWAELSDGKCLFVMPKGKDLEEIRKCIEDKNSA